MDSPLHFRLFLRRWRHSDLALLLWRLLLVYFVLMLCRAIFWIADCALVGPPVAGEWGDLLRGALRFDTAGILYANALFIVMSLVPFRFRAGRIWRGAMFGYYMLANGLSVALNLADAVYFRYAQKRFTADELFFASNDNSLRLVWKFTLENWYLVPIFIVLVVLLGFGYRRRIRPDTPIARPVPYYAFGTIVLSAAAVLTVGGIRGGFSRSTRPITLSNAAQYAATPGKANLVLSNPFCVIRTLGNRALVYERYYGPEELAARFTPYHRPAAAPALDLRGRNVVVFLLESFSAEHSALLNPHLYPDGQGFTPFLDSLMRAGYRFSYAFANGRKSIEALPSVLGSIPSFKTPFVLLPQSLAESRQLPRILSDRGYATAFFCGSPRGSMGFGAYARSAGIERFFGEEDYEAVHGRGERDGYWGIWDEPFLAYMGEELDRMPQPFFATVFTLSSHHPFVVPDRYRDSLPAGRTKVHRGVAYTDMALRRFFERYGGQEWLRNTIFVFTADHVSSEKFAPETFTETGGNRIIAFMYTPDGALRGEETVPVQQLDLMPTLLGLLAVDEPYFAFGRDLLNEPDRPAVAVAYSTRSMEFMLATDSTTLFFDERKPTALYARRDSLQRHDLFVPGDTLPETGYLKAVIQQYYEHLDRRQYTVPAEE